MGRARPSRRGLGPVWRAGRLATPERRPSAASAGPRPVGLPGRRRCAAPFRGRSLISRLWS